MLIVRLCYTYLACVVILFCTWRTPQDVAPMVLTSLMYNKYFSDGKRLKEHYGRGIHSHDQYQNLSKVFV